MERQEEDPLETILRLMNKVSDNSQMGNICQRIAQYLQSYHGAPLKKNDKMRYLVSEICVKIYL